MDKEYLTLNLESDEDVVKMLFYFIKLAITGKEKRHHMD